jgi:hypothetical protein
MTLSEGLRDTVLRQLWAVRAIERLNTRGSSNRRYFITSVGQHLLTAYEELLEKGLV